MSASCGGREASAAFVLAADQIKTRPAEADERLAELAVRFPDAADGWDQIGKTLLDAGLKEAALQCISHAMKTEPTLGRAVLCGMMFRGAGRAQEARAAFETALREAPESARAWFGLAACERDLGRRPEAANAYRRAIASEPGLVQAHINLGKVLQAMGDLDAAKTAYGRALAIRADTLWNVVNALTSESVGELWLDVGRLRRNLEV